MKMHVTAIAAAGALYAAAAVPAVAAGPGHVHQGFWDFGFGNDKVCASLDVTIGPNSENGPVTVTVVNTDMTSEKFAFNPANAAAVAIYDVLQDACDHADDNARGPSGSKTYTIYVTGTPASGLLPATFGGVVGNLPTAGTPNAGTRGFITEVTVKTNNR